MRICGVDEAGRGPLAGPVVAAAAVFSADFADDRIRDSKALSEQQREKLFDYIRENALAWSIVAVGPRRIETLNILQATKLAMRLAVERIEADLVLVDGNQPIVSRLPQRTVVGGDRLHVQISAASILAKVWRDRLMKKLAVRYPGYGFERHSGYPTPAHKAAILELGPCKIHRATFAGVVAPSRGGRERSAERSVSDLAFHVTE
ncbi:MAG: Ribonuclease [Pseudomonadota bacterium]|jgi:ribonuclease HII